MSDTTTILSAFNELNEVSQAAEASSGELWAPPAGKGLHKFIEVQIDPNVKGIKNKAKSEIAATRVAFVWETFGTPEGPKRWYGGSMFLPRNPAEYNDSTNQSGRSRFFFDMERCLGICAALLERDCGAGGLSIGQALAAVHELQKQTGTSTVINLNITKDEYNGRTYTKEYGIRAADVDPAKK